MGKLLILIRHGHRDTSQRESDNGLDEKGQEQAKLLKRFLSDRFSDGDLRRGLWLVSSPKRRCLETLTPIAKGLDRAIDIHPSLDEQGVREASGAVTERVRQFLTEWRGSKAEITLLCSHGDWLPIATWELLGLGLAFKKGAWVEIAWEDGRASLRWMVPSFKQFYS